MSDTQEDKASARSGGSKSGAEKRGMRPKP